MRIAVIADIHGNVRALEAVLRHIDAQRSPDMIVNLGDCASGPLWPVETMALLARRNIPSVRGNHDRAVATVPPEKLGRTDGFARRALGEAGAAELGALPFEIEIAPGLIAFHARPDHDQAYLIEDIYNGGLVRAARTEIARRLGGSPGLIALCGHSHRADLVMLENGSVAINPGSVGCPAYHDPEGMAHVSESGSPHARYAMLAIGADRCVEAAFHLVPYDHEEAARQAEGFGRPDWAFALRHGFMGPR